MKKIKINYAKIKYRIKRILLTINPDRFIRPHKYWSKKQIEAGQREAERLKKIIDTW